MTDVKSPGTRINEYLVGHGYKKCVIAKSAGMKINRFTRIINNHADIKVDELLAICKVLNVPPSKFMDDPTTQTE